MNIAQKVTIIMLMFSDPVHNGHLEEQRQADRAPLHRPLQRHLLHKGDHDHDHENQGLGDDEHDLE